MCDLTQIFSLLVTRNYDCLMALRPSEKRHLLLFFPSFLSLRKRKKPGGGFKYKLYEGVEAENKRNREK